MTDHDPTLVSQQKLCAVEPALSAIAPLKDFRAVTDKTLFHAGPPLTDPTSPPAPLLNGILAAIVIEGWAGSREEAETLFASGEVSLSPAQDAGIVTPLAFVVGPSTVCLKVIDIDQIDRFVLSPLNDGPPPHAIRFGTYHDAGLAVVRSLIDGVGSDLSSALKEPMPLLPKMAAALADGDELHGRVTVMQKQIRTILDAQLTPRAIKYLDGAGQFALNAVMAAAALMIKAGTGIPGSRMIIACGGNGESLGFKVADAPDEWLTKPATRPIGGRLPGLEQTGALPAIGDSAVIDALGLGAACLRFSPEIAGSLQNQFDQEMISPAFLDHRAHNAFIGPHPGLGNDSIRVGLDLTRPRGCLGINLGIVEETGKHGLIGRGVAPWPEG